MRLSFIFMTLTSALLTCCTNVGRKNHIVAIDNSTSVPEKDVQQYFDNTEKLISGLGEGDSFTLMFIDGCQTKAERIFRIDLASIDFNNKHDGLNHAKDSIAARRKKYLHAKVLEFRHVTIAKRNERTTCRALTDIIRSLSAVEDLAHLKGNFNSPTEKFLNDFSGKKNYTYSTVLYIFSDMIHEDGQGLNFNSFSWLSEADVVAKVEQLKAAGQVPHLDEVTVFVSGATASSKAGIAAPMQATNIKIFWNQFFQASGAKVEAFGYDTRMEMERFMYETK